MNRKIWPHTLRIERDIYIVLSVVMGLQPDRTESGACYQFGKGPVMHYRGSDCARVKQYRPTILSRAKPMLLVVGIRYGLVRLRAPGSVGLCLSTLDIRLSAVCCQVCPQVRKSAPEIQFIDHNTVSCSDLTSHPLLTLRV